MGTKKITYILSFLLVLTLSIVIILSFKTNGLQQEIEQERALRKETSEQTAFQQELMGVDSLLVAGDYKKALGEYRRYSEKWGEDGNDQIELRIAVAQKMGNLRKERVIDSSQNIEQSIDTNQVEAVASPREIKQYDSLSFVLEKTKVQLARMKRLVNQKSFGEYLTFTSTKGSQVHYVGQVANGKAHGHGMAILSTGSRYEGEWKNNLKHGEGTFFWTDGQYYEGEYNNDKRHGIGTYHWSNGEKFVGLWEDDQRTGEGIFYGKDGKIVASGIWEDDKLIAANKP